MFKGDTVTFDLTLTHPAEGQAWLRTNIGHAAVKRNEIIKSIEEDIPVLGKDWFDIPMKQIDKTCFRITLPLNEIGHFEAKCYFSGNEKNDPNWPEGENTIINVEPSFTCCANIIYNAFVRQFGPNQRGDFEISSSTLDLIRQLDGKGYAVIPPSGTFRDFLKKIDFVTGTLGCRIIQLLPVHPTPTTYAKMGRFGSPYAALSFTAVDPALAEFDPSATPLEQFGELIDTIHKHQAKIVLDFAINHTGWAASLHESHPQWLIRDENGRIENPGAWGVVWSDLTRLDYSRKDLWKFMANVFLLWCKRGVDGFRCDAGYMIPVPAWQYIISVVRNQYPDTLFFLEGLGGKISATRDILNTGNFNWAYSELFQNYDRPQIEHYLPEAWDISRQDGLMVHFAETHDNNRLASRSNAYAKMRTALCALTSVNGCFGFANGVEWLATEKINVHQSGSLNWGAVDNQVDRIQRLSVILKNHPSFFDQTDLKLIETGDGNFIALLRHHKPSHKKLVVLVNLDTGNSVDAFWKQEDSGMTSELFLDLLSGKTLTIIPENGILKVLLEPCGVLCLTDDPSDRFITDFKSDSFPEIPARINTQLYKAKALEIIGVYRGTTDISDVDANQAARHLEKDPVRFCREQNNLSEESRVISWLYPCDLRREVMVPPAHFLLIRSDYPFRSMIIFTDGEDTVTIKTEEGLKRNDGTYFALYEPIFLPVQHQKLILKLSVFKKDHNDHVEGALYYLSHAENVIFRKVYGRSDIDTKKSLLLRTNGRGGMLRSLISWGRINSKYDALLAANLNPLYPVDRWVMFTRLRGWVVFQGYSQEINFDCFHAFAYGCENGGFSRFYLPVGQGEHILLTIGFEMLDDKNAIRVLFYRHPSRNFTARLDDAKSIQIILRPDIESRNFHYQTKAFTGPEHHFPSSVTLENDGFIFHPSSSHILHINMPKGSFVEEKEWYYMNHRPDDEERGMDGNSDLYSPGYFKAFMKGNDALELIAECEEALETQKQTGRQILPLTETDIRNQIKSVRFDARDVMEPMDIMKKSLSDFIVKRGALKSVIAGYPWFLDWGRDSLIFTRGLIAAGLLDDSKSILKQFGTFEEDGTLPNMISGTDAGNRDTADAALWFFKAVEELVDREGNECFLDKELDGRPIRKILTDIGHAITQGTKNGIYTDPESGLVFSPSHFTWMDTNFPAGTPREGYCIEIQALWFSALSFLAVADNANRDKWQNHADQVRKSVHSLFINDQGYLSDCLYASSGAPARSAEPDNAVRPNQLFAITLGVISDQNVSHSILERCAKLVVPGAIRSLADEPVIRPLHILFNGQLLNDPYHPYTGTYHGDEDTKRKPAYHNGTAWTWVFPSFCEAWVMTYGNAGKQTALSLLSTGVDLLSKGAIGHMPEILDGDYPHKPKGCDAQAWAISEYYRVWKKLV